MLKQILATICLVLLFFAVSIANAEDVETFLITIDKNVMSAQAAEQLLVDKGYVIEENFSTLNQVGDRLIFSVSAPGARSLSMVSAPLKGVVGILSIEEEQLWTIDGGPSGIEGSEVPGSLNETVISDDLSGQAIPNDPSYPTLWGMTKIEAPDAWDVTTGGTTGVIIVIDTGINHSHPYLSGNMASLPSTSKGGGTYGLDTVNGDNDPMDDNSHGSHCAGTIGAVGNNSLGVVGVNWKVKMGACKFLNAGGGGSTTDAIKCMDYVAALVTEKGVKVIATSNSWGGTGSSTALKAAIDNYMSKKK